MTLFCKKKCSKYLCFLLTLLTREFKLGSWRSHFKKVVEGFSKRATLKNWKLKDCYPAHLYRGQKAYLQCTSGLFWWRRRSCPVYERRRTVFSGLFRSRKDFRHHCLVLFPRHLPNEAVCRALDSPHPTDCSPTEKYRKVRTLHRRTQAGHSKNALTRGATVEVVVVLRDVRQDTEAVRNLESHHVFCIQQCRNSQLLLCNLEGLQIKFCLWINKSDLAVISTPHILSHPGENYR